MFAQSPWHFMMSSLSESAATTQAPTSLDAANIYTTTITAARSNSLQGKQRRDGK